MKIKIKNPLNKGVETVPEHERVRERNAKVYGLGGDYAACPESAIAVEGGGILRHGQSGRHGNLPVHYWKFPTAPALQRSL